MARPVIINDSYLVQAAGDMNMQAVREVCDALPLIVPADPDMVDINDLLCACDGFIFPGGRPNVHPEEYGEDATPAHGDFD